MPGEHATTIASLLCPDLASWMKRNSRRSKPAAAIDRKRSVCKKYEYLYYECKGHTPLSCGRQHTCPSRRVRADRLDAVVWHALSQLLQRPTVIPRLHQ